MTLPSGRVAKWVILALWIALLLPAFMLAGKLGDVEKNDNSAWLPNNAEATKVVGRPAAVPPAGRAGQVGAVGRPRDRRRRGADHQGW